MSQSAELLVTDWRRNAATETPRHCDTFRPRSYAVPRMADAIALDSPLAVRRPLAQRRVPPLFRHRGAVLGVVIVAGILLLPVAAPILPRPDPLLLDPNIRLQAPNAAYPC